MDAAKECPKCGFILNRMVSDCPRCGVIIAKFLEREKRRKEFQNNGAVPEPRPLEPVTGSILKQIVIFILLAVGIWLGWTHLFQRSETDLVIESDGEYAAETKISNGEQVDLRKYLVPGGYTVFLFYADW